MYNLCIHKFFWGASVWWETGRPEDPVLSCQSYIHSARTVLWFLTSLLFCEICFYWGFNVQLIVDWLQQLYTILRSIRIWQSARQLKKYFECYDFGQMIRISPPTKEGWGSEGGRKEARKSLRNRDEHFVLHKAHQLNHLPNTGCCQGPSSPVALYSRQETSWPVPASLGSWPTRRQDGEYSHAANEWSAAWGGRYSPAGLLPRASSEKNNPGCVRSDLAKPMWVGNVPMQPLCCHAESFIWSCMKHRAPISTEECWYLLILEFSVAYCLISNSSNSNKICTRNVANKLCMNLCNSQRSHKFIFLHNTKFWYISLLFVFFEEGYTNIGKENIFGKGESLTHSQIWIRGTSWRKHWLVVKEKCVVATCDRTRQLDFKVIKDILLLVLADKGCSFYMFHSIT